MLKVRLAVTRQQKAPHGRHAGLFFWALGADDRLT